MEYQLPPLSYPYDALEPYIDAKTMEIHHGKHHQAYLNNLNTVLQKYPNFAGESLENLLGKLDQIVFAEEKDRKMFRNNAGGHLNHGLFWQIMSPKKETDENLLSEVKKEFASLDEFKKVFSQTALSCFGSGWAWLVKDKNSKLQIYSLPNQDSPYLQGHVPIMGIDVWEHAYYLKYQNRKAEYIENWWNVLKLF